ncbi:MAG: CDC48 family AAA ATPase [Candidatus Thorarchaeota archaeon]
MANLSVTSVRVAEASAVDVGRFTVRLDPAVLDQLQLADGSLVEITGKKSVCAIAVRDSSIQNKTVIKMDGLTRLNAGVRIGDIVTIHGIEAQPARSIVLTPLKGEEIEYREELATSLLKTNLLDKPIKKDIIIAVGRAAFALGEAKFYVAKTVPVGNVLVNANTTLELRKQAHEETPSIPTATYDDVGGLDDVISRIREIVELPLRHPELYARLKIEPPRGVLLHGPPGCGKTLLARTVATESEAFFRAINGPEIVSQYYGESEKFLRDAFQEAEKNKPAIIFIDEIDAIAARRESGGMESRIVAQLLTLMDGLQDRDQVFVLAATNRLDTVDPALRRPGRFDREIHISVPDTRGRHDILRVHTRGVPLDESVNLLEIAQGTHGFVGSDLAFLVKEAALGALRRVLPKIEEEHMQIPPDIINQIVVTDNDFKTARQLVEPSALREIAVEIPMVHWNDVGGMESAKQALREAVELPITRPDVFTRFNITPPKGVLLFGPPGTGKTLLAKAVATESQANFISIRGAEVMSKWVGESEKIIAEIFRRARQTAPSILFIDELDNIAPRRGSGLDSRVSERIVNQLLVEMDGMEELESVVVLAATNRPDMIDDALLRPGRFDIFVFTPPPNQKARQAIFTVHTQNMPLAEDVRIDELASATEGFSGADIQNVCRKAVLAVLRNNMEASQVNMSNFQEAIASTQPSITQATLNQFTQFANRFLGQ